MRALTEVLVTILSLLETEGRAARRSLMRAVLAAVLMVFGLALLVATLVMTVWGLYTLLAPPLGPSGASFITAGIVLLLALILLVSAKWYAG